MGLATATVAVGAIVGCAVGAEAGSWVEEPRVGVATATGAVGAIVGCFVGSDMGSSVVAWSVGAANSGDGVEQASSVARMINEGTIRKLRIYGAVSPTILDARNYTETAAAQQSEWEQARRRRWRALLRIIRANLKSVETGITTLESEFLANIVLPDGGTVGQWLAPQVDEAYAKGNVPPMLGAGIS